MIRFSDQALGPKPHIAVLGSDKVGNFVVTTPLLRGLKEKYPDAVLTYFGSVITQDLEEACPYIDARFTLYGATGNVLADLARFVEAQVAAWGPVALAINCDGFSPLTQVATPLLRPLYSVGATLRSDFRQPLGYEAGDGRGAIMADMDWNGPGFVDRHAPLMESNYIAEILCKLAYIKTDYARVEVASVEPAFEVPDVILHMTTTRPAKMWLPQYWAELIRWLDEQGVSAGLVGSKPEVERALYGGGFEEDLLATSKLVDLRGQTKLTELAGVFKKAKAAVVVDAGPLHLAAGVGCPTVALFGNDESGLGASPVRLWGPRANHVIRVASGESCDRCVENRFKNPGCLVEGHPCMRGLGVEGVKHALSRLIRCP